MTERHRTLVVDASHLRTCRLEVITQAGMLVITVDTTTQAVEVHKGELPPETEHERTSRTSDGGEVQE
jgi:hypothetical protein